MLKVEDLSYWERKTFLSEIDFLIVGAGIVGYSTAIHLREKYPNARILILERGYLPSGASSKNAGFACFGSASELLDDLDNIPEESVWETVRKRWEGLHYLKSVIGEEFLDLQSYGSWDIITEKQNETIPGIRSKLDYLNGKMYDITGVKDVFSEDRELKAKFGFSGIETSFHNKLEGQIDTGKMIRQFYRIAITHNIDILFGIHVDSFENFDKSVQVKTNIGELFCSKLCLCTNGFAGQFLNEDVKPARAQVLVTEPIADLKIQGTFHYDRGYYYFRNIDNRILLGGGRNLDFTGETTIEMSTSENIMKSLEKLLSEVILPGRKTLVEYRWSGIMGVGEIKAPIVKKIGKNVGTGVRMGGMGVAIGTGVGKELAELF